MPDIHGFLCQQDTFKLPQLEDYDTNTENILTTRAQPGPFSGCALLHTACMFDMPVKYCLKRSVSKRRYTVLHCHFLHHQDVGCMSVVQK